MTDSRRGLLTWLACTALVVLVFLALGPVISSRWLRMAAAGGVVVGLAIIVPTLLAAWRSRKDAGGAHVD